MTGRALIYLDNHSTTPVDPRVVGEMLPYFTERFGNAASRSHGYGWVAEEAVNVAREQIVGLIGGSPREVVFTSGATESDNLAIKGTAWSYRDRGRHIVTCATEHKAVLDSCARLEAEGFSITRLVPAGDGLLTPDQVAAAVTDDTILCSIMHVNNEIGVVQPISAIGAAIKARSERCLFHCDAVQGIGKLPFRVDEMNVDMVSISAHKMYGPKGVGALWVRSRPRIRLAPLLDGGGHERGMRSGTLPVPNVVGFGVACELAGKEMADEALRIGRLRDRLWAGIRERVDGVHANGSMSARVTGNLNVSFEGVDGEALLLGLAGVAVSSGAACTSATLEPSYVLRALGVSDDLAHASIRFGLGRFNTLDEIETVIDIVASAIERLRAVGAG